MHYRNQDPREYPSILGIFENEVEVDFTIYDYLLKESKYTRSGRKLDDGKIRALSWHWTGNAGAGAKGHYRFFSGLNGRYASYNLMIGLDANVYVLIPPGEVAWHSGPSQNTKQETLDLLNGHLPNHATIGISFCHKDWDGEPTTDQLETMVALGAYLCDRYDLDPEIHNIRHFDCTGKECPRWFVRNEDKWDAFLESIKTTLKEKPLLSKIHSMVVEALGEDEVKEVQ